MKTKINIEDRLLSQDRWIAVLIFLFLGLLAFVVLIAEVQTLNQDQEQKSPKQELQAIFTLTNAN